METPIPADHELLGTHMAQALLGACPIFSLPRPPCLGTWFQPLGLGLQVGLCRGLPGHGGLALAWVSVCVVTSAWRCPCQRPQLP